MRTYKMVGLTGEAFRQEWHRRWCKGKAQSFVARGREPLSKVMKTLNTTIRQGLLSHAVLGDILQQVGSESVSPFVGRTDYSARLDRLKQLKQGLGF